MSFANDFTRSMAAGFGHKVAPRQQQQQVQMVDPTQGPPPPDLRGQILRDPVEDEAQKARILDAAIGGMSPQSLPGGGTDPMFPEENMQQPGPRPAPQGQAPSIFGEMMGSMGREAQAGGQVGLTSKGKPRKATKKQLAQQRKAQMLEEAAQQGSVEDGIAWLDHKDPSLSIEVRKEALEYEQSVVGLARARAKGQKEQADASKASMMFLGEAYNTMLKQPEEDQAKMYKAFLPEIRKHDPNAPDEFDPLRAKIAEGFGVSQLEEFKAKQDMEEKKMSLQAAADKPTTDVEKMELAKRKAMAKGDKVMYEKLQVAEDKKASDDLKRLNLPQENAARGQYISRRNVFGDVAGAYAILDDALKLGTTQGDVTAIYNYVKMNDDNAVKEGEISMSSAVYGYQKISKLWAQAKDGTPLTPQQRIDLAEAAVIVRDVKTKSIDNLKKSFQDMANRNGWNPENVTPSIYADQSVYEKKEESGRIQKSQIDQQASAAIERGVDPKAVRQRTQELYKQYGY